MKIIKPSATIMDWLDVMKCAPRIEQCGRVCYKSERGITTTSHQPFCRQVMANGHNSVLEMAVVSLRVKVPYPSMFHAFYAIQPKFLVAGEIEPQTMLVTGSIRAFRELFPAHVGNPMVHSILAYLSVRYPLLFEDQDIGIASLRDHITVTKVSLGVLEAMEPDIMRLHRMVAVKLITNRVVTHEIVRHRPCSFLQESQRYCRYDKEQFGGEVTFIKPLFFAADSPEYELWRQAMAETERLYLKLLKTSSPQAARTVLPNSCKTEIIVFATMAEWQHIFRLRTSTAADPSMREVMIPLADDFASRWPQVFGGATNA